MELTDLKETRLNGTVGQFLEKFCRDNATKMQFPDVDYFVRQELVSIVESEFSKTDWDSSLAVPMISTFRTIARDEHNVDVLFTSENVKNYLLTWAKLPEDPKHQVSTTEQLEAIKCLVNAQFKSQEMRKSFGEPSHEALRNQLKALAGKTTFSPEETLSYNLLLRILFISTALQVEMRPLWSQDNYFNVLNSILEQSMALAMIGNEKSKKDLTTRVSEVLKTLYNLYCKTEPDSERTENILKLSRKLLFSSFAEDEDCCQNCVSLIFALPVVQSVICPKVQPGQKCLATFEDRDMSIMKILLEKLEEKVDKKDEELLTVFVTSLLRYCVASQQARRYVRLIVLPPLKGKDVERHPDEGDALRNKLIRIMKSVGNAGMVASELMFVLCKKSVNRMIKYTGFGHSAGFMANAGLLGQINAPKSDEDSEDSETEEYAKVEDRINPVTGCIRPENMSNPFEGMSEEQKMYEAEQLMNNLNKMLESGVIKPATIGEDGKTRPLKHVLEMTKNIPDQPDDSDSE